MEALGIVLFALGILVSVAFHEYGHAGTARAFGMKVTRFFVGFGPTLFAFRRGETEYGFKAIPAGAFVKIVGMTPQDDDVAPADQHRAMWRFPVWKRTIVMSAGSVAHFILGLLILWGLFAFSPLPDYDKAATVAPVVDRVSQCVESKIEVDPATGQMKQCDPQQDPSSPAAQVGLRHGDTITAIDGGPVSTWDQMTDIIRASGGKTISLTFERDGASQTKQVTLPKVERLKKDLEDPPTTIEEIQPGDLEQVGVLGITQVIPETVFGPVKAVGMTFDQTSLIFERTWASMKKIPQKVPKLWAAITGEPRDPETPVSVVGASRIGGQLFEAGEWQSFMLLLAGLNFFVGIFNLLPLLPLDGGHIAIAWFEKSRSWLYARLRRPDPGRVDYFKLMPVTYVAILILGGFFVLTVLADIINPIRI